ncbi:ribonuclease HIII [Virgibacillus salinus]|uniref:Ribonuclease HIII n=1 Tax=Virgibacillus salinus TaxID=553311 RepID=A0A1H1AZ28_9BACI|nr:ribonuclease HIII [Virgibacillus salinus]SDQ44929.1 ribonuclease HIII [Virgibacillus salinus]
MPQNVYVIPQNTIEEMRRFYANALQSTPQGAIFRAKTSNAVITAYKSGKVMFQGNAPAAEAKKWINENTKETKKAAQKTNAFSPPDTLFTSNHIGSDEAGTGDYFGPITVAAAFVKKEQIELLKELGVKDSKNLTDSTIRKVSKDIMNLDLPYSLLILHNEKYNKLQKQGWTQGKMKAMLHHHAINNLLNKIGTNSADGILIDQFCEPAVYKKHIATEQQKLADNTYFMTKAESYSIAVAAGSIIARTSFLSEMDKLSAKTGIALPKGASKKVDQTIASIIKSKGEKALNSYAKTHFANTKKAKNYL